MRAVDHHDSALDAALAQRRVLEESLKAADDARIALKSRATRQLWATVDDFLRRRHTEGQLIVLSRPNAQTRSRRPSAAPTAAEPRIPDASPYGSITVRWSVLRWERFSYWAVRGWPLGDHVVAEHERNDRTERTYEGFALLANGEILQMELSNRATQLCSGVKPYATTWSSIRIAIDLGAAYRSAVWNPLRLSLPPAMPLEMPVEIAENAPGRLAAYVLSG